MTAAVVVGILVIHNIVTNLWLSDRWTYVPVNLATSGVLAVVAGAEVPVGAWWPAVAAALVVVAGVALVAVVAPGLVADRRMAGVDVRGTAWRALMRIPLGTVVLEEVAFRAVLPAVRSPAASAGLFGLWHAVPAARTLDTNGVRRHRAMWVAVAVVLSAGAGAVLWELREATGGLAAPALVHVAVNSGATVAAYVVLRRG